MTLVRKFLECLHDFAKIVQISIVSEKCLSDWISIDTAEIEPPKEKSWNMGCYMFRVHTRALTGNSRQKRLGRIGCNRRKTNRNEADLVRKKLKMNEIAHSFAQNWLQRDAIPFQQQYRCCRPSSDGLGSRTSVCRVRCEQQGDSTICRQLLQMSLSETVPFVECCCAAT